MILTFILKEKTILSPWNLLIFLKNTDIVKKVPYATKTHIRGGSLDLIIISEDIPVNINNVRIFDLSISSDHFQVCFDIIGVNDFKIQKNNTFIETIKL